MAPLAVPPLYMDVQTLRHGVRTGEDESRKPKIVITRTEGNQPAQAEMLVWLLAAG